MALGHCHKYGLMKGSVLLWMVMSHPMCDGEHQETRQGPYPLKGMGIQKGILMKSALGKETSIHQG